MSKKDIDLSSLYAKLIVDVCSFSKNEAVKLAFIKLGHFSRISSYENPDVENKCLSDIRITNWSNMQLSTDHVRKAMEGNCRLGLLYYESLNYRMISSVEKL